MEFNNIIRWAEKNNLHVHYSRDVIFAVQMVYYTFFILNSILLIALTGIIYNLINIYFNRRKRFYAINMAIGMTPLDILCVMFFFCQIFILLSFILVSVIISGVTSSWLQSNISAYAQRYFDFTDMNLRFPFYSF
jgi:ABC-type antimicrobial peptide transport system permease subunit